MGVKQQIKAVVGRNPALYETAYSILYRLNGGDKTRKPIHGGGRVVDEVFDDIWRSGSWSTAVGRESPESVSGHGSRLDQTENIRAELPKMLYDLGVKTFLDAPCGDLNWMLKIDLAGIKYVGGDIVPGLIDEMKGKYLDRTFRVLNVVTDDLLDADMWMCRDCFIHLPNEMVLQSLWNFTASNVKYLLTSTFNFPRGNSDIMAGEFRRINLRLAPFNLPAPLRTIRDYKYPADPHFMGLWTRDQVAAALKV